MRQATATSDVRMVLRMQGMVRDPAECPPALLAVQFVERRSICEVAPGNPRRFERQFQKGRPRIFHKRQLLPIHRVQSELRHQSHIPPDAEGHREHDEAPGQRRERSGEQGGEAHGEERRQRDESPLPREAISGPLVYDLTYGPGPSRLLRDAKAAGALTIDGLPMLVAQAERQFEWWNGQKPDT